MEIRKFECPNCGANIEYVANQSNVVCEYCGGKFSLETNVKSQKTEKNKDYLWLWIIGWIFCFPIPLSVLIWKSQKLDNKWKTGLTIALWGGMLVWGKVRGIDTQNNKKSENMISVGVSYYELLGDDYEDTKTKFEVNGFTNIISEEIPNDSKILAGSVEKVSINGDTDFSQYDKYPNDAKVVIKYYATIKNKFANDNNETKQINQNSAKVSLDVFDNSEGKTERKYDKTKEMMVSGFHIQLPDYYEWNDGEKENVVILSVEQGVVFRVFKINLEKASDKKEIDSALDNIVNKDLAGFESRVAGAKEYKNGENQKGNEESVDWYSLYECDYATKKADGSDTFIATVYTLVFNEINDSVLAIELVFDEEPEYYHVNEYEKMIQSLYYSSDSIDSNNLHTSQNSNIIEGEKVELDTTESVTTEENTIPYCDYSGDRNANVFISYYNYFYNNEIVQKDVDYSYEGYIPKTVIHFDVLDFIISEMDGSPSYKCISTNGVGTTEKNLFFESVKKMISATYPSLSESYVQSDIINELISKENASPELGGIIQVNIDNSPNSFSFETIDDHYEVYYHYSSY